MLCTVFRLLVAELASVDVEAYICGCHQFQTNKPPNVKPGGEYTAAAAAAASQPDLDRGPSRA